MTNEEASKAIQYWMLRTNDDCPMEALCTAVEALKKQIPKRIISKGDCWFKCPSCGYSQGYVCEVPYHCVECGQRLRWEEKQ